MVTDPDPTDRCQHIRANWAHFLERRSERRAQQENTSVAPEKVAEGILEDLFTLVLGWSVSDAHRQEGYAGLLLARSGVNYLMVAVRRPGSLMWYRRTVEAALEGMRRHAVEQGVKCIAVSDGVMLYAADIKEAGLQDRVFVYLGSAEPQETLCWLSVDGVSRSCGEAHDVPQHLLPEMVSGTASRTGLRSGATVHPKYGLPARCFAYVGHPDYPDTWKLPYLLADGAVDSKRLPKAIQSIVSNYRGANVRGIPGSDIPDVLVRLGRAAVRLRKMPHQSRKTARTYQRLAEVLAQLDRLEEVADG